MRIAIDARWIFQQISGIGAYTLNLIEHLAKIDQTDHTFVLIFNEQELLDRTLADTNTAGHPRIETTVFPYGVHSPQSQLRLPGFLKKQKIDVFHSTNYMIPLMAFPPRRRGRIACITTIHDMIPMLFPDAAPNSKKTKLFPLYKKLMRMVGQRADRIITDSDASKRDIIKCLEIPASDHNKVRTIYCGVGKEFTPAPATNTDSPGILYVGRADPYKNLVGLVQAFANAREKLPANTRLLIAGAKDSRYPQAETLAQELGISDHVIWTGYLSQEDLVQTYRDASVLCLPSRCEGFGLPVVEAMAVGTPVICSNAGSLPEVAGDAAIQHDPDDLDALSNALVTVLTDSDHTQSLITKGYEQAARFSWARTAAETLALYEELGQ